VGAIRGHDQGAAAAASRASKAACIYVKCFFSIRMVSELNKKLFNICCKKQTLQMNLQATIVKPEARPTAVHHICKQHP